MKRESQEAAYMSKDFSRKSFEENLYKNNAERNEKWLELSYLYSFNQDKYKKIFDIGLEKKRDDDITFGEYENAVIIPIETTKQACGVFTKEGKYVEDSSHKRVFYSRCGIDDIINMPPDYMYGKPEYKEPKQYIDEDAIYLGPITNHWGHFLMDFTTRLWICKLFPSIKKYFVIREDEEIKLFSQIKDFLNIIDKNIQFISKSTRFRKVIVPQDSYVKGKYYSDKYLGVFQTVTNTYLKGMDIQKSGKLFLNRMDTMESRRREYGLEVVKDLMVQNGYYLINPGRMPLNEMIINLNSTRQIVGICGSDTHNILFINSPEEKELVFINRSYDFNDYQRDCLLMKCARSTYIDAYDSVCPVYAGIGPHLICYSKEFQRFVADRNMKNPSDRFLSDRYIRRNVNAYLKAMRTTEKGRELECREDSIKYFEPENANVFIQKYLGKIQIFSDRRRDMEDDISDLRKGRQVALYGAGNNCRKFLKEIDIKPDLIIDREKTIKDIGGIPVVRSGDINLSDYFIVITIYQSLELEETLQGMGLEEWENYICYNRYLG